MQEIITIQGKNKGPNLCIFVGVHGDEVCGIIAAEHVLSDLHLIHGSVTFIVGNPLAVERGVRFTEMNLNRAFRSDDQLTLAEKNTYEYKRSRELIPWLAAADALLDIHSSASKTSKEFIICEPHSYPVARYLPASIISSGWDTLEPGGTDYYMNSLGKVGITFESGYHTDQKSIERAEDAMRSFLKQYKLIDGQVEMREQKIINVHYVYHTVSDDFRLVKEFSDFEAVSSGQLIAHDGTLPVYARFDGVIIFARNRTSRGSEGFLLAY